ncbi:hypothetical protein VOLCADRAFT_57643 [Volvox carteri f. nagariensis]|uniref:Protein SGT1 homolog n=1 Tax=Volvox carteri f. nagariensis TaxID=3068 RepID=D8TNQ0_VOLCA|nr:uncharacterized protein VOLCADRAFT_57643 [Volvox carteri f. nagariensis]EFJ50879.1 hypothetical protein VOLCADRAFT_57643 [Volvox carteri f. nagariensis]|eukprot:XP_002947891.1 hypothetical protein VOLCADRAFT_57643 [Volvox carteri f. nagariensis]
MSSDLVARGDRLFVEEDYAGAVEAYSEALREDPTNARIYEARANAYIKLEQFPDANADATKALELSPGLAKAYLRKGVALFSMEEYEAAKEAFEAGCQLAPDNTFKTWIRKCDAELEAEDPQMLQPVHPPASNGSAMPGSVTALGPASSGSSAAPLAPSAPLEFGGKYRHQHYQLANKVTVDVYAKKLRKEQVAVEFGECHLKVVITDLDGNEEYKLDVDLYGKVIPAQCKYEVLSTKVEITMVKADQLQWGSLEQSNKVAAPNYSTPGTEAPRQYPSSKQKDWSKVESELNELEAKGELDMGDPLNNFFKKIFAQGDEDTRRAMMKSFVESNGTVLSTNWAEVGNKKIECTPPDGMEVRKWEV